MKIIFDFDDVLFDAASFKATIFSHFQRFGISDREIEYLYKKCRSTFSIRKLYKEVASEQGFLFSEDEVEMLYRDIFKQMDTYLDRDLLKVINTVGKENCYVISAGEEDFQKLKMKTSGLIEYIAPSHSKVVKDSKKEEIISFCKSYKEESILFVDDKEKHIQEALLLDIERLHPILYDKEGFKKLTECISKYENYKSI